MANQINLNSLPVNDIIYVSGLVDFSRITSHIDGEELVRDNERRVKNNMRPDNKPHTRMTISNAAVVCANPSAPTLSEQAIGERLYMSKAHPEKQMCFTAKNKTSSLPAVYSRAHTTVRDLHTVLPEGEIAAGTHVTLILRIFGTQMNNGISLDAVIVDEEPVRFANALNAASASALSNRGFNIIPASTEELNAYKAQLAQNANAQQPAYQQPVAQPNAYQQPAQPVGYAAPAQPATYTAPAQPAAYTAPAQPAYVAPAQPAAPVQSAYVAPAQPAAPAQPVQPAPAAPVPAPAVPAGPTGSSVTNDTAPSLPVPPPGYAYDANGQLQPTGGIKLP